MFGHRPANEATDVSAEALGIGGLFGHLRDAMVVADEAGRIVLWNPAATSLFGYVADEAIGENVEMLVPPRPAQSASRRHCALARHGKGSLHRLRPCP